MAAAQRGRELHVRHAVSPSHWSNARAQPPFFLTRPVTSHPTTTTTPGPATRAPPAARLFFSSYECRNPRPPPLLRDISSLASPISA